MRGGALIGTVVPLSRPGLTAGPPSPAGGRGYVAMSGEDVAADDAQAHRVAGRVALAVEILDE